MNKLGKATNLKKTVKPERKAAENNRINNDFSSESAKG